MTGTAAVIGCGDVSVVHFEALSALRDVRLVAVCDVDPETAARTGARYAVPWFTDHRVLLAEVRPDVVHVCTPHHQHADPAIDAIESGVHVVMEKPVAQTVDEAERVIEAAERHPRVRVGVCLQNRYNAAVQAAREILLSGAVGEVLGGSGVVLWHRTSGYYDARPWRRAVATSGGGVLINQAIHTIDLLEWLLGPVTGVSGHADRHHPSPLVEVEDTAQIVLQHGGGARSVLFATVAYVQDAPVTIEIVAEHAVLSMREDLTVRYSDGRVHRVKEREADSSGRGYWGVSHTELIADFYGRLDDPDPFWISPREATRSLRIIAEVYATSRDRATGGQLPATAGSGHPETA
jgi:UDP-N-acetyl-2-amino-2-deoxyglucuronate dehydrogenase